MGLMFAGKCSQAAEQIYLVTRTLEQRDMLLRHGLQLKEDDEWHTSHVSYTSFADQRQKWDDDHTALHIDWLFLFVKQQHIDDRLIHYIKQWTDKGTRLLCFQNGIGHIERLVQAIPPEQIFTAVTTEAALKQSSYQVKHTGIGETWIGHENSQYALSDVDEKNIMNVLNHAGFVVYSSKNMKSIVWKKLLINAVINPLTAILQVRNGELLSSHHWKQAMRSLYDEGRSIADALRIDLPSDLWEQVVEVCQTTALNTSSMLSDRLEARMTEIEWINGALIRIAEQRQIRVPTHHVIYQMIKGIEPSTPFSNGR